MLLPGLPLCSPVVASDPVGPLTGIHYPSSLIRPDKRGFEPRVGLSWRPIPASTVVVRAGYGIYDDTSVYQTSALQMAQQYPLSTSLSVRTAPPARSRWPMALSPAHRLPTTPSRSTLTSGLAMRRPGSYPCNAIYRERCSSRRLI